MRLLEKFVMLYFTKSLMKEKILHHIIISVRTLQETVFKERTKQTRRFSSVQGPAWFIPEDIIK